MNGMVAVVAVAHLAFVFEREYLAASTASPEISASTARVHEDLPVRLDKP
jgi:hypothetical protein